MNYIHFYNTMFYRDNKVLLEDGETKIIQDIQVGDVLKTQSGVNKVKSILTMNVRKTISTAPYKIGNLIVSGNHLVRVDGKLYYVMDVGEQVQVEEDEIVYYHLLMQNGFDMELFVENQQCESWDGYELNVPHHQKDVMVFKRKNNTCVVIKVKEIKYRVE